MTSLAERYFEGWAHRYDADMADFRYAEPAIIFEAALPYIGSFSAPLKILDIGIGTGLASLPFRQRFPDAHITGVDASGAMLEICRAKGVADALVRVDVAQAPLPFESGLFDVVLSAGVIEYLGAPDALIKDISRVLKPSGVAALSFEPQSMRSAYKSRIMSGVIKETGYQTVVRCFIRRGLWGAGYLRYLYAPEAIESFLSQNRFSILNRVTYDAYCWPRHPIPIQHCVSISRILF
ncbi:MAG: class I SAM-dependent methyltransferase [Proteobacteria bacterium]|nr:class I SAM-dependent methyltransferase [Pseudomonadota bacterium]